MSKQAKSRRSRSLHPADRVVLHVGDGRGVGLCGHTGTATSLWRPLYHHRGSERADLFPTRLASGRVESGKRTIIECEFENIAVGVRGQRLTATGASVLLSVVPEGQSSSAATCLRY